MALALLATLSGTVPAGDRVRTAHVELTLLSEHQAAIPGETLWLGLHFQMIPHWHIYWRNPGDSGEPPRVDWQLPPGWRAGEIHWPTPQRIPVGHLLNYGYTGAVTLLVPIETTATPGDLASISADLSWLVCREACIPEQGSVHLDLPLTRTSLSSDAAQRDLFERARSQWPLPWPAPSRYSIDDSGLELTVEAGAWPLPGVADLWFAASEWGPVAPSGAQPWKIVADRLHLRLTPGELPLIPPKPLDGLLVLTEHTEDGPVSRGFTLQAAATAADPGQATDIGLPIALGLALLGGLLLNLMPCVLPVLSIKVLGLVRHAGRDSARHGLAFLIGVLLSFGLLGALLLALRSGGAALGWGFQLQEPAVIIALLYLMLAVALNLSGTYALGGRLAGIGQGMTEDHRLRGSLATGALAVLVASPCTAPFMGGALGFALTRPAWEALAVFVALGLGFALPMWLLSIWPQWTRRLPPPGAWMERLRNALAFPMYGAAAWLLWVLAQQVDSQALAMTLGGALLLSFALWWHGQNLHRRSAQRLIVALGVTSSVLLGWTASRGDLTTQIHHAERWSPQAIAALRAEGRPALVNFTAAWCITCKVNEQVALDTDRVRDTLAQRGISYLKADWTRRDADIGAELERHGRSGVPLYLLYPSGDGEPRVLPQILTEGILVDALNST